MWETLVSTAIAIGIAWYFSRNGQPAATAGIQPNLSGQAPLQGPGVTSGYAVPATNFLLDALPPNPFAPPNAISAPATSSDGGLPDISMPGDSLYYAPVQAYTFAGPSFPQSAQQPSTVLLPIVMPYQPDDTGDHGKGCGCCDCGCAGGNQIRFVDGTGGYLKTQKGLLRGASANQYGAWQNQISSVPDLSPHEVSSYSNMALDTANGGVPTAPARKFSFSQY